MLRDIEMQYPATIVAQDDKHKQHSEGRCWHGKEIERDELLRVILKKSAQV